jgi:hypothetical protein
MSHYTAKRNTRIGNTYYAEGEEIPSGALLPNNILELVSRGHVQLHDADRLPQPQGAKPGDVLVVDPEGENWVPGDPANLGSTLTRQSDTRLTLGDVGTDTIAITGGDADIILPAATTSTAGLFTADQADRLDVVEAWESLHIGGTGADHSYIDQDVTEGSAPILDATNFTNTGTPQDTGLRNIHSEPLVEDGWEWGSPFQQLSRVGNLVTVNIVWRRTADADNDLNEIYQLPQGFRPAVNTYIPVTLIKLDESGHQSSGVATLWSSGGEIMPMNPGAQYNNVKQALSTTFYTNDDWPTDLPGEAV